MYRFKIKAQGVLISEQETVSLETKASKNPTTFRSRCAGVVLLDGDAVASCAQKGYAVTAVVVDLDGVRQAMLRGNGAPIHTLDNAFYKAYSAASLTLGRKEESTKAVADRISKNPPTTVPQTPLPNITYATGGVTIMANGTAIGAIGVSGAPGGQFDEECARAALAKVRDRIK